MDGILYNDVQEIEIKEFYLFLKKNRYYQINA